MNTSKKAISEINSGWVFDYIIVGAGFSGLVLAERLATQEGKSCLVVERRNHIGGNAHDEYDDTGVLIHKYGPHYFRSNSQMVVDYLSQFTEWHPYEYKIKSSTEGRLWNFPINLNTFEQLVGKNCTEQDFIEYLTARRIPVKDPKNSEEIIISQVGWELYEKFFKQYTIKQWGRHPRELDASVCGRIPIRTNRDDRYLSETFQALPKAGYHKMFDRIISASPLVKLLLKCDYRDVVKYVNYKHMIYTGPVDEYFDCCYGPLPYRSLRFEQISITKEELDVSPNQCGKVGFWQPVVQVNYPNDQEFTRIVELKHATGQICGNTTIVREYPQAYSPGVEPYYPIPTPENRALYLKYYEKAKNENNVTFVGRLATYKYYNMDQVVAAALHVYETKFKK